MPAEDSITATQVREVLDYEPETGLLRWRKSRRGAKQGTIAGCKTSQGYVNIRVLGRYGRAHRVIWLWMTGDWPKKWIDHINGNPSDNRWNNLRECTPRQNQANRKINRNTTSGYKGVCWDKSKNKWMASITRRGENKFLGYFDCPEEAHQTYCEAADSEFGEFANPG